MWHYRVRVRPPPRFDGTRASRTLRRTRTRLRPPRTLGSDTRTPVSKSSACACIRQPAFDRGWSCRGCPAFLYRSGTTEPGSQRLSWCFLCSGYAVHSRLWRHFCLAPYFGGFCLRRQSFSRSPRWMRTALPETADGVPSAISVYVVSTAHVLRDVFGSVPPGVFDAVLTTSLATGYTPGA